MDYKTLKEIKEEYEGLLFLYPNVVAVGIGYKKKGKQRTNELAVIVNVDKKLSVKKLDPNTIIPATLTSTKGSAATDVVESGKIRALALTKKVRPLVSGYSIGHVDITAGTLGCFVRPIGLDFIPHILSNNHILGNINKAKVGDKIIQPGIADGGTINDTVAELTKFIKINMLNSNCPAGGTTAKAFNFLSELFGRKTRLVSISTDSNLVDCAIARINGSIGFKNEIYNIGKPLGIREAELGMNVQKSGRTTGHTVGEIVQVDVTVQVMMGLDGAAVFTDQVVVVGTKDFSASGDSGSAVLDMDGYVVGLLFAGGEGTTIVNRIANVFDALDVELW